jgi:hypothetical protein
MVEILVAPDTETLIVKYLTAQLAARSPWTTTKAYTKVPKTRPAQFVRVLRTGGTRTPFIDTPTLAVESWAGDGMTASNLAQMVRALLFAIDRVTYNSTTYQFYAPQEFSGPANLPDPDSDQERYTETFSVGVRATAV